MSIGPGQMALTRMPDRGHLAGGRLGEADHRVLGGDVGRDARRADEAGDRGRVDDGARLLLQHDRQHVAQPEEHALDVDADHLVEHRLVVLGERLELAFDAGIVEEAVDAAVGVERGLHVGLHLGRLGDVGGLRARLPALLLDGAGGALRARARPCPPPRPWRRAPANASAVCRPMPLPAPVMTATLPLKSMGSPSHWL